MRSWKVVLAPILAGVLCIPMWGQTNANVGPYPQGQQQGPQAGPQPGPQPGMLNYLEGQASIGGQALNQNSVGVAQLRDGQSLATQNGRVELLLTPGVLLRLDRNSAVVMDSTALENTEVAVQGGRAMVEVDQILPANHIAIHEGPATVVLTKNGLYDFDATRGQIRVFNGRAEVTIAGKTFTVKDGHQFDLNATKLKARGFNEKAGEDAFYRWGSLRSSYLAEANADAARGFAQGYYSNSYYGAPYAAYYGGWYGPGWFWDPYFDAYTWLPGSGIFYSPFGFGFYSPAFAYAAPFYGYGYRGGYHHFGPNYRPAVAARSAGGVAAGRIGGGFAGSVRGSGFAGGGFHGGGFGGGGGFHGGGGGGRR